MCFIWCLLQATPSSSTCSPSCLLSSTSASPLWVCATASQLQQWLISKQLCVFHTQLSFHDQSLQLGHGVSSADWRPGGTLSFEVRVSRLTSGEHKTNNRAVLIVGSIHDDVLLAHECFTVEQFPSPLQLNLSTRTAPAGQVKLFPQNATGLKWEVSSLEALARSSICKGMFGIQGKM